MSPDVSQCLPSTPNDSNSPSLLPNQTPKGLLELATASDERIRIRALLPERAQSLQAREEGGPVTGETKRYDNLRRR